MSGLSQEQQDLKDSIKKSSTIWAVVVGLVTVGIIYWILNSQTSGVRMAAAALSGVAVAISMYRKSFASGSKSARCGKCDAAFSITRTDRVETVISTEDKEEREPQEDGSTSVKTWGEEKYSVLETYTCSKCQDVTTKTYDATRRKDEKTEVEAAPVVSATKSKKQKKSDKS